MRLVFMYVVKLWQNLALLQESDQDPNTFIDRMLKEDVDDPIPSSDDDENNDNDDKIRVRVILTKSALFEN